MLKYLLDTNTLIQAKNLFYAFDIVPSFWLQLLMHEEICTIDWVVDEVDAGNDYLTEWFKENWKNTVFRTDDAEILGYYRDIANFISNNEVYKEENKQKFLSKADPWIIATAKKYSITVVTQETPVEGRSKKIKIPNICYEFGVSYVNLFDMMRELHISI